MMEESGGDWRRSQGSRERGYEMMEESGGD